MSSTVILACCHRHAVAYACMRGLRRDDVRIITAHSPTSLRGLDISRARYVDECPWHWRIQAFWREVNRERARLPPTSSDSTKSP